MKIAIVEDDKTIREELSKLLKKHDYDTILIEDFDNIPEHIINSDASLVLLAIWKWLCYMQKNKGKK